jgi:hypothetical protein
MPLATRQLNLYAFDRIPDSFCRRSLSTPLQSRLFRLRHSTTYLFKAVSLNRLSQFNPRRAKSSLIGNYVAFR